MHNYNEIQEKVELVKNDILTRFPGCNQTIKVLLWDDGWYEVSCTHGDTEKLYVSKYYNGELSYYEDVMLSSSIKVNADGREYYAIKESV